MESCIRSWKKFAFNEFDKPFQKCNNIFLCNLKLFLKVMKKCHYSNACDKGNYYKGHIIYRKRFVSQMLKNSKTYVSPKCYHNPLRDLIKFNFIVGIFMCMLKYVPGLIIVKIGLVISTLDISTEILKFSYKTTYLYWYFQ